MQLCVVFLFEQLFCYERRVPPLFLGREVLYRFPNETNYNRRPRLAASIRGVPPLVGESGLRRQAVFNFRICLNSPILPPILQLFATLLDRNLRPLAVIIHTIDRYQLHILTAHLSTGNALYFFPISPVLSPIYNSFATPSHHDLRPPFALFSTSFANIINK